MGWGWGGGWISSVCRISLWKLFAMEFEKNYLDIHLLSRPLNSNKWPLFAVRCYIWCSFVTLCAARFKVLGSSEPSVSGIREITLILCRFELFYYKWRCVPAYTQRFFYALFAFVKKSGCKRKMILAQLVEALPFKPEGRGFDSRLCHWNFSLTQSFRPHS
jgi:hypothetical protein